MLAFKLADYFIGSVKMKSSESQVETNRFNATVDTYVGVNAVGYTIGKDEPMVTQKHLLNKAMAEMMALNTLEEDTILQPTDIKAKLAHKATEEVTALQPRDQAAAEDKPVVHVDVEKGASPSIWHLIKKLSHEKAQQDAADKKSTDYLEYFKEVEQDGKAVKKAELVVNYAGKPYSLSMEIDADKFHSDSKEMRVNLAEAKWSEERREIVVENQRNFVVKQEKENLSIDVTYGLSRDEIETRFGDPDYRMKLTANIYMPREHQMDAVVALRGGFEGEQQEADAALGQGFKANKKAQLIIAGTGTGKTGIGAVYAHAMGKCIIVVPEGLEKQAADDINDFIAKGYDEGKYKVKVLNNKGVNNENSASYSSEADLQACLDDNKFLVVNHSQLRKIADQVKGKNIFIDEVHEITSTPEDLVTIKHLKRDNKIVGVTATPSTMTYEALGKAVSVISLPYAQQKLGAVRKVVTSDEKVGEQTSTNNNEAVATKAVELSVKRDWLFKEGTSIQGANVQGMIFTDNPEVTALVSRKLEEELTQGTEVGLKMREAQKQHIADSMNADLITALNFKKEGDNLVTVDKQISEKGLQKLSRDGELAGYLTKEGTKFKDSLQELHSITNEEEFRVATQERMKKAFGADMDSEAMKPYFEQLQNRLIEMAKSNDLRAVESRDVDPSTVGARYSVSLNDAGDKVGSYISKDDAQILVKKGLTERVVSEGALGTGYSNPNILSTILTQTVEIKSGDTAKQNQQAGRPIRDKDGQAFVGTVKGANIVNQRQSAKSIFSEKDCIVGYNKGLVLEQHADLSLALAKKHSKRTHPDVLLGTGVDMLQENKGSLRSSVSRVKSARVHPDVLLASKLLIDIGVSQENGTLGPSNPTKLSRTASAPSRRSH